MIAATSITHQGGKKNKWNVKKSLMDGRRSIRKERISKETCRHYGRKLTAVLINAAQIFEVHIEGILRLWEESNTWVQERWVDKVLGDKKKYGFWMHFPFIKKGFHLFRQTSGSAK